MSLETLIDTTVKTVELLATLEELKEEKRREEKRKESGKWVSK
jgi:hypothetical protein